MSLTLQYWGGRGLMEVARVILAIGGKFPSQGDYTDSRLTETPANSAANLGRMPLAHVGEESIGQSAAIYYYVAAENGLMGANNLQAAQALAIYEHVKELNAAFRNIVAWGVQPTEEQLNKWFDEGANDSTGAAAQGDSRSARFLTWWLGRIEAALHNNGFAVGNKLSLADVMLWYVLGDHLTDADVASPEFPQWRREPFGSKARTDAKLANYPKIKASVEAVAAHPNVQKWLAERGPQGF